MAAGASPNIARTKRSSRRVVLADAVFYIQKGKVKITVVSEQGKEAVVAGLGPDEFCGEGTPDRAAVALSDRNGNGGMRDHAAGESRLLISRPPLRSQLFPRGSSRISWRALSGLKRTWSTNCSIQARSAWHGPFFYWANFGKDGLSRANHRQGQPRDARGKTTIGTTRSRVSYFMNKFRKLGLIDYNGQIEIHTSLLNLVLHEEPRINS